MLALGHVKSPKVQRRPANFEAFWNIEVQTRLALFKQATCRVSMAFFTFALIALQLLTILVGRFDKMAVLLWVSLCPCNQSPTLWGLYWASDFWKLPLTATRDLLARSRDQVVPSRHVRRGCCPCATAARVPARRLLSGASACWQVHSKGLCKAYMGRM